MEIVLTIESLKSQIKVFKDSAEVEAQYNALLSIIRDLEIAKDSSGKISVLEDTLDLLGLMMLAAPKDIESE